MTTKEFFDKELSKAPLTEESVIEALDTFKQMLLNCNKVNRIEVINHASVDEHHGVGRIFTHYDVKSCELDFQDNRRTLKIFI